MNSPSSRRIEGVKDIPYIDRSLPLNRTSVEWLEPMGDRQLARPVQRRIGATIVTIDKSLKVRRGALKSRNVLTRVERIERLLETDRWRDGESVLGLPKVRVQKLSLKKKKKVKKEEEAEGEGESS